MLDDVLVPASSLEEASIVLDGQQPLTPNTIEYEHYYVERPRVESSLLREAQRARRGERPFHWFFTGHTGSGKSTELNRIVAEEEITRDYAPISIDLESEFDVRNIDYTDIILAMGKGCASKAEELRCAVPKQLREAIDRWGEEIVRERETTTRTEGQAGLKIPFLALGEEIRSGGAKREIIRRKIAGDLLGFIRLIDGLGKAVQDQRGKGLLCVLDGLDHTDVETCRKLLHDHYETLVLPRIAKIVVIPLALLNTPFLATIERHFSTVPNIKVFTGHSSADLDPEGLSFYRRLIAPYIRMELLTAEAAESLFRLSAGIVRDMIRNTGDACGYAAEEGARRTEKRHAERVWHDVMRYYRMQLQKQDYEVLREVRQRPYIQGINGVPPLLHSKAVVFYPNGEGWYGVHPAVQRVLDETG